MSPDAVSPGLLVAVVGPSGAGKDTLIRLALADIGAEAPVQLARRVITRPPDGGSEDHDSLDAAGFARAEAEGAFCLAWRAHGLAYGLPRSVEAGLAEGVVVVANLSRRSLGDAASRFARLAVVEVTAPREVLVGRIAARGRESAAEIERRLARQVEFEPPPGIVSYVRIENVGAPETGAARLRTHLLRLAAPAIPSR
ncbi:phosphonate metabolism protein/1,5-bisphosphokinase (PRPP-forming) PhnN [Aureimonas leprariae]|uniref:Ribose 1,5-bisphosphate phosphokinase PhnN n=1 Tax=Plantimonas leprariae TaxID=2615207 RepID=A0A7V7PLV0_9HYPH|nr:phosphonate metabolism protein/1,5-bisphosphokinase (PRPP-forming) PhnN [Aureimonas leprariae]KAB0677384.1 phosphonate metabolism protein/1,5-bisphosphokinase (PRPP-forming) PhnN [Aureimonas leprariae]